MFSRCSVACLAISFFAAGCGDDDRSRDSGNVDSGAVDTGTVSTDGGRDSAVDAGEDSSRPNDCSPSGEIQGIWDLMYMTRGEPRTGVISACSDSVSVEIGEYLASFPVRAGNSTAEFVGAGLAARNSFELDVTHDPSPVDLGDLVPAWGGDFSISRGDESCEVNVRPALGNVACTRVDLPVFPLLYREEPFTLRRRETAASIFGDLGGTWTGEPRAGPGGGDIRCTARFVGNGVDVSCNGEEGFEITFSSGLATGLLEGEWAFSMRRRS